MSQTFKLFRLQQIDRELDRKRARLKEIENQLADDRQIRVSQLHLEKSQGDRDKSAKALRKAEQAVQGQRMKIERSEATLYGGKVVNPKELQDLQQEAEALKRYLSTLEDRQLEAMLDFDEKEMDYQMTSEAHSDITAQIAHRNEALNEEKNILMQDMNRLEGERRAATSSIPDQEMEIYKKLRKQKNGVAVAGVIERTCAACGSTLSAAIYSSAQIPNKITYCSTCGRILYVG
jgi:predicted  nucleic acid-binding Zn-ribbon protein